MSLEKKKIPVAWLFVLTTFFLFLFTFYTLRIFAYTHDNVSKHSIELSIKSQRALSNMENYKLNHDAQIASCPFINEKELIKFADISNKLADNLSLMSQFAEVYHYIGLLSFVCSICTFFIKPRKIGLVGLPFGLLSLLFAIIAI